MCGVSLTHSLRLFKPHLARHKYIIIRRLHWMPLKLESFSCENNVLARDCDLLWVCAWLWRLACAAGNNRIGSESVRRETDRPITDLGRACEKSDRFWSLAAGRSCTKMNLVSNSYDFISMRNKRRLLQYNENYIIKEPTYFFPLSLLVHKSIVIWRVFILF